jgi:hypothetical protein
MNFRVNVGLILAIAILMAALPFSGRRNGVSAASGPEGYQPSYAADGNLIPPADYRDWVYISTGFDMSYVPNTTPGMHMFDNVFVNREAYEGFLATGHWPDKTVMVLEARGAVSKGSINQSGNYQAGDVMGMEIHVKDEKRFAGGWAFFDVESPTKTKLFAQTADCYSCHKQHAAVDTTFVQFYPTLLPVAQKFKTLSAEYVRENAAQGGK